MNRIDPVIMAVLLQVTLVAFTTNADEKKGADKEKKELEITVVKNSGTVKITAKGKSGYHCNTLYPWKVMVEGPESQKKTYKKKEAKVFTKEKVIFEVPRIKGQKAKLKMSVCNDKQCIMHTEELSW